jgi:hypothetical protein
MKADFMAHRGHKVVHGLVTGGELEGGAVVPTDPPQNVFVYGEKDVLPSILTSKKMLTNCSVPCIIVRSHEASQEVTFTSDEVKSLVLSDTYI